MPEMSKGGLVVKRVRGKGRGVFAMNPIAKRSLIECAPILVLKNDDCGGLIDRYTFDWNDGTCALALGFGSLYNHSYTPNARYWMYERRRVIEFVAIRDIEEGEEITINYGGDPSARWKYDFDVR